MPKNLQQLPKIKESISFIYVEHCKIEQDAMAIAKWDKDGGCTPIPIANISCLLVGPGTTITHAAIKSITDCGASIVWCGENATRFYASGRGETKNAKNLLAQAKFCCDEKLHMDVVRKMYAMRFSDIPTENMTLNQLRGMEGVRMKNAYLLASRQSGIPWKTRDMGIGKDWNELEPLDKALIHANKILYALCSSVILAMGFSTGLGFVHTGRMESFSYDIADLYKADTTIPAAFAATKIHQETGENIETITRKECRKYFQKIKIMKKIPKDIASLFTIADSEEIDPDSMLWNSTEDAIVTGSYNLANIITEE